MHMRSDVYLEPVQIPIGYARASGRLGATLLPHTPVEEILTEGGSVAGVRTPRGEIRAPVVVDAAGAWLRVVAALGGATVKVVPTRHQLMVTVPLPGVRPDQPITRIIDANVYVRPEKGGLMLGGYEPDPVQYDMGSLPADFDIEDLELDLSVLRRLAESVAAAVPGVPRRGAAGAPGRIADDDRGWRACPWARPGVEGSLCDRRLLRRRPVDCAGAGRAAGGMDRPGPPSIDVSMMAQAGGDRPGGRRAAGSLPAAVRAPLLVAGDDAGWLPIKIAERSFTKKSSNGVALWSLTRDIELTPARDALKEARKAGASSRRSTVRFRTVSDSTRMSSMFARTPVSRNLKSDWLSTTLS